MKGLSNDGQGRRNVVGDMMMPKTAELRFAADFPLARLARWLRTAGFDTTIIDADGFETGLKDAAEQGRCFLTRRREVNYPGSSILFIASGHWREQFAEVMQHFDIQAEDIRLLVRCEKCNGSLAVVADDTVVGRVPSEAFEKAYTFLECPDCRCVYWGGPQTDRIRVELDQVFLYFLFRCHHCGRHVPSTEARFRGSLRLQAVSSRLQLTDEDLSSDNESEIDRLLARIATMSEEELNEGVAVGYDFTLCRDCYRSFLGQMKSFLQRGCEENAPRIDG